MKKTILIGLGLIAVVLLVSGCTTTQQQSTPPAQSQPSQEPPSPPRQQPATANSYDVSIKDFNFMPADLTIKQGDKVTWTNQDTTQHTVRFTNFESGSMGQGSTYNHVFNDKGTFTYHCGIHPSMTGHITVT